MFRIDTDDAAAALPAVPAPGAPGYFTDGDPLTEVDGTTVPAWFLNMIMMEIVNVILEGGGVLNKGSMTQLRDAISEMIADGTGGGLTAASTAETIAGALTTKAVTPASLKGAFGADMQDVRLPNGLIIKCGTLALGSGTSVVTNNLNFPAAFPTALLSITGNADGPASGTWNEIVVNFGSDFDESGGTVRCGTAEPTQTIAAGKLLRWIAIGY